MAFLFGCENVRLEYPAKTVFTQLSSGVSAGQRIGVVGQNGEGKSSLLGLFSGRVKPDEGRVLRTGGVQFASVAQADALDDAATVQTAVVGNMPEYEWAGNPTIREIIGGLMGDVALDARVETLSGGQRRRVDLARALIEPAEVLLLDEPTNHLDLAAINWLAKHLRRRFANGRGALVVVTHDRWFLDEVCETMWEVHAGRVIPFEGGYSAYILQRVERQRQEQAAEAKRQNLIRRELAFLSRGARARSSKPKFHVKAAQELIAQDPPLRNSVELKRAAISRLGKQCVNVEDVSFAYEASVDATGGAGSDAASAMSAGASGAVSAGAENTAARASHVASAGQQPTVTPVLNNVTWLIGPGDRYGLLGANGAGKSTLLDIVRGKLKPQAGRVKIGKTVQFAFLSQKLDELEALRGYRVHEVLALHKTRVVVEGKEVTPAKLLEQLGFNQQHLKMPVESLSGGQKRRLQLMLILLDSPNVLILDEPSNDLDTDMLVAMENLLDEWPGTLIVVSHDRYLLERVTDSQFALINGTLRHVPRGVDEYLELLEESKAASNGTRKASRVVAAGTGMAAGGVSHAGVADSEDNAGSVDNAGTAAGMVNAQGVRAVSAADTVGIGQANTPVITAAQAYELRKQVRSLEGKITTAQTKLAKAKDALAATDPYNYEELVAAQEAVGAAQQRVDNLEEEWLLVSEELEGA